MNGEFPISGVVKPGFEKVAQFFEANFTTDIDVGAGLCIYQSDELLVDLWGGYTDRNCLQPWQENTLVNVYSTTKGMASIVVALAVESGYLDYEAPVRDYWPDLKAAENGLTVAQLLSHQGGLCGVETPLRVADLYNWDYMTGVLEKQSPLWEPGTLAAYHAITWGYLAGELVRRTMGTDLASHAGLEQALTLGQLFNSSFAKPLEAEVYIGLPEQHLPRVAEMISPKQVRKLNKASVEHQPDAEAPLQISDWYRLSLMNPLIGPYRDVSTQAWRSAEIPAANGQASAKGVAKIYAGLANQGKFEGKRIIGSEVLEQATREEVGMVVDPVLQRPVRRARGFVLNTENAYGPNDSAYGHSGAGGSLGFADPIQHVGFGYVMNQMQGELGVEYETRATRLVNAFYSCL